MTTSITNQCDDNAGHYSDSSGGDEQRDQEQGWVGHTEQLYPAATVPSQIAIPDVLPPLHGDYFQLEWATSLRTEFIVAARQTQTALTKLLTPLYEAHSVSTEEEAFGGQAALLADTILHHGRLNRAIAHYLRQVEANWWIGQHERGLLTASALLGETMTLRRREFLSSEQQRQDHLQIAAERELEACQAQRSVSISRERGRRI